MDSPTGLGGSKIALITLAAAVGIGGGAYAWMARGNAAERNLASGDAARVVEGLSRMDKAELAAEENERLRSDALEALKKAPLEEVFDRIRSPDLSEEERQRLESNLQQLMMEDMERKVNAYFDAPPEQQPALLDQQIDEMQKFMADMQAYREKHKDDPRFKADEEKRRQGWNAPTTQQRKEQMESRNPDQMVRMFRYWGKMRERAQERGIEFGPGRRGSGK